MGLLDLDLSHLTPTGTARYTLTQVNIRSAQPVVLIVKPSGEANEAFAAALKSAVLKGRPDAKQHASLYAHHVIAGWANVHGPDGKAIAYSAKAGEELLHGLLDAKRGDIVGGMMAFASDPDHFTGARAEDPDLGNG